MSKHLKVALVDDDIPNTEVLRDFLIRNGYSHVDKYHDGESFLESLDRFDERAVVLDFDLSGGGELNGLEVLEAVIPEGCISPSSARGKPTLGGGPAREPCMLCCCAAFACTSAQAGGKRTA